MAITIVEYALIRRLRELGLIATGGSLIEFGEANWYGDVTLDHLGQDIGTFGPPEQVAALRGELQALSDTRPRLMDFDLAKIFYKCFLQYTKHVAVDLHGTKSALKHNLNEPLADIGQFDIMFDFGTGEHVFDVRQFFANAHNVTKPGGLMIHGLPWTGWIDHGFYNFQPTVYFDIAAANNYTLHTVCYSVADPFELRSLNSRDSFAELAKSGGLAPNTMLFGVMTKGAVEAPFYTPMQGYYDGALSKDQVTAWRTLR
jgi:SAM-dependent methyltransferase